MSKAASIKSESVPVSPVLASAENRISCQLDACRVRILLLPLTEIPETRLRFYRKVIVECHSEIQTTNSVARNTRESSLSHLNINFMGDLDPIADDFTDFQLHFRTFAIIGLVTAEDLNGGVERLLVRFNSVLERFPYSVCARIFVIDCEDRISSLHAPFVSVPMNDIAGTLDVQFASIGSEIVAGMSDLLESFSARPALPSPCGIEDYSGTASRPSTKHKMKTSSRLQKLAADLHVLTGKFSDAVAGYAIAVEDAKNSNDLIWQTAALEGFQIALCLQNEALTNIIDPISYKGLVEKLLPLAVQYERSGVPMLSVLLQLNCAKILFSVNLGQQALSVVSDAWKTGSLLGIEDRLVAFTRILDLIGDTEFHRKWSFYASQLALNFKSAHEFDSAIETFSSALGEYSSKSGWDTIKATILKELLRMSENSSSRLLYFIFAWKCLSMCSSQLDGDEQMRLLDSLRKRSKSDVFCLSEGLKELSDLPIFVSFQLQNANNGLYCSSETASSGSTSPYGPFIYAPNQDIVKKLVPSDSLICEESSAFRVTLRNPFVFPIQLRSVRLLVEGCACECDTTSLLIPPQTEQFTATLSCKPRECGSITILGVSLAFMSVQISFFSPPFKANVIPSQPILQFAGSEFDKHIRLFEGELLQLQLPFTKQAFGDFRSFNVSFAVHESNASVDERIDSLIFDEPLASAVQTEAELETFESSLPIAVEGHPLLEAFTASILYSAGGQFWRKLDIPFHCHLQPVIRVLECQFFPGASKTSCTMSLFVENCLDEPVYLQVNEKETFALANREASRVFFSIPRLCLDSIKLEAKLPLNEKQVAIIRKLKHSDTQDFLDTEYEEQLYDHAKYWIKKHLIETVHLTWRIDSSKLTGKLSLSRISFDLKQFDVVTYRTPLICPNVDHVSAKLGEAVQVAFKAKDWCNNLELRIIPLVDLGNDRLAVNHEDVLLMSGPLVSIIRPNESRVFSFIPISTANFQIRYEVKDLNTGKLYRSTDAVYINTIN